MLPNFPGPRREGNSLLLRRCRLRCLCWMAEGKSDTEINPDISEDEDSDDEVSLLVVDEDELQIALEAAGISIKVRHTTAETCCFVPGRCQSRTASSLNIVSCVGVSPSPSCELIFCAWKGFPARLRIRAGNQKVKEHIPRKKRQLMQEGQLEMHTTGTHQSSLSLVLPPEPGGCSRQRRGSERFERGCLDLSDVCPRGGVPRRQGNRLCPEGGRRTQRPRDARPGMICILWCTGVSLQCRAAASGSHA